MLALARIARRDVTVLGGLVLIALVGACRPEGTSDAGPGGAVCGDGVAESAGEACDGADLAGASCASLGAGFTAGTLGCTIVCTYDTSACLGVPSAPVLRKPFNGEYLGAPYVVGALRPVFEWEPSTPIGAATVEYTVELATDPTFSVGVISGATFLTVWGPPTDLAVAAVPPVGARYWWRVRGCAETECSAWTDAWSVHVGRARRDFNGDGYDDVAVTTYEDLPSGCGLGRALVFFGGSGAMFDSIADGDLPGPGSDSDFGSSAAVAGDVNGDGYADLLVGAKEDGQVSLYWGGPGGVFNPTADLMIPSSFMSGSGYGWAVAGPGDVNDDGYADILVGLPFDSTLGYATGAAELYYGGPPFDTMPDVLFASSEAGSLFGERIGGAGDVDGDGYPDVLIAAPTGTSPAGMLSGNVFLYRGGPGMDGVADLTFPGTVPMGQLGYTAVGAGDVNGDGYADVLLGSFSAEGTLIFLGAPAASLDAIADAVLTSAAKYVGTVGGPAGDVNGDGFADILAGGSPWGPGSVSETLLYMGNAQGVPTLGAILTDSLAGSGYGFAVAGAGDLNGDGFDDVITSAPWTDAGAQNVGAAYVYFGGAGDFDLAAEATIFGTEAECALGTSVAQ